MTDRATQSPNAWTDLLLSLGLSLLLIKRQISCSAKQNWKTGRKFAPQVIACMHDS